METRNLPTQTPPRTSRSRQFSIFQLLCWTAVVALMCAPLAYLQQFTGPVLFALTGLAGIILMRVAGKTNLVGMFVLAAILCFLVAIMNEPLGSGPRGASRRMQCANNIKQIALALNCYHSEHGSFPPAYVADEDGKPMHSWRVLILPYLERQNLYEQYRFDEPWNGPQNRFLHNQIMDIYNCPSETGAVNAVNTNYFAIVGEGTAWPGARGSTFEDFQRDGTTNTILIVEVQNSGIHWMEPRDLDFATTSSTINQGPPGRCICSDHGGGANVAMADGSVHFLPDTINGKTVQALITIDGGEIVDSDGW